MDSYSSILNEEKNNNRSDPTRMNNLARLRPEKLDDVAVKDQILMIQQQCENVDPEIIALVFHECDYNMQKTITRIKAGEFQDGGWQTAKSTNKKKIHNNNNNNNHNQGDQILNGGTLSDSERSLSQRTSPTSSLRGGHRRNDQYQYQSSLIRTDGKRRGGNDANRNQFNSRYSARTRQTYKPIPPIPSEISLPIKQLNEDIPQITSSLIDEYEFVDGPTQSLTFNNSQKKTLIQPSSKHHRLPSSIPQEPVFMHPTVQFSTEPIDIQFGDVQWNDSVPKAISPSRIDNHDNELSSIINIENSDQTTNNTDNQLPETTNQFSSSLSITDNTISNNIPIVSPESTSHLSDHLTNTSSSSIPNQYSSQSQEPVQIPIPITRLPPTSTPRAPEYTSSTSQFIPTNLQPNNTSATSSSAFIPFNRMVNYPSISREYSQTANWNPQSSNYKTTSKPTIIPTGTYPQQPSYHIAPQQQQQQQQQQIYFGTYPYSTLSPTVVQVFAPFEHWPPNGYSTPLESYSYPTTNYIPTYPNQQQYHQPTKYVQHSFDKDFFSHYGQLRSSTTDPSYQQASTSSQSTKDTHITSKLSPTAATFSQGVPLAGSPSGTALYLNPVTFSMPNYYPSMGGTTHQDNRDNRNGAANRTNYYHHGQQQQQQQRTHNNNVSNSTWH